MPSFKHSGDLGDVIYGLPAMKALGGGILYLDPRGGESNPLIASQCPDGKTALNETSIKFVKPLLEIQSYVNGVEFFRGQPINYDLDLFRNTITSPVRRSDNLVDCSLQTFNLPYSRSDEAWISVDPIRLDKKIVIANSPRRAGNFEWMLTNKSTLFPQALFVGLEKEHEFFEWIYKGKIEHYKENTIIDLAQVILGSELFISNSTFMLTLAVAMNHPNIIHDVYTRNPTTKFPNRKMRYI